MKYPQRCKLISWSLGFSRNSAGMVGQGIGNPRRYVQFLQPPPDSSKISYAVMDRRRRVELQARSLASRSAARRQEQQEQETRKRPEQRANNNINNKKRPQLSSKAGRVRLQERRRRREEGVGGGWEGGKLGNTDSGTWKAEGIVEAHVVGPSRIAIICNGPRSN